MVAGFPGPPIVIGACIAITVAMTIRQDLQLAPVVERLSTMARVPRALPEESAPLTAVQPVEEPAESLPTGELIRSKREANDSEVNNDLGDRGLNLEPAMPGRGIDIMAGNDRDYSHEENRRVKLSRDKAKGKRDKNPNNKGGTPPKMGIRDLLLGIIKIINDALTAPLKIIQHLTHIGNN